MRTRVAIIGTVGIPAKYGGFETLAEHLVRSEASAFEYLVFCSSKDYRTSRPKTYCGARLVYLPLSARGVQSIFYDITSIVIALGKSDILLLLGTSGCVVLPLIKLVSSKKIVVNIDGLEHKRPKWSRFAKMFLKFSEYMAVTFADLVISDNKVIQEYVASEYSRGSELIEYGGDNLANANYASWHSGSDRLPKKYFFKVCRIEPENNVQLILDVFKDMPSHDVVIIGNWEGSSYGRDLKNTYGSYPNIFLKDPIYNTAVLNEFRANCFWYLHGHSAGGTNPSLVEAMYLGLNVVAFSVPFNEETTEGRALYFGSSQNLKDIIMRISSGAIKGNGEEMKEIADRRYRWRIISRKYLQAFEEVLEMKGRRARGQRG